jgi:hypothetical protein
MAAEAAGTGMAPVTEAARVYQATISLASSIGVVGAFFLKVKIPLKLRLRSF